MSEKIELEVIASKNEQSFQTIEQDLKQLEKPRAAEIALNLSRAKTELAELKKLQKEALKVENFDLADKIGQQVEIASKKVTTINRQLTNFQRTGNENLSMLGQMFQNVNQQISNTEAILQKVGKNTEWLDILRKKAEEFSKNLKSGNITMEQYQKGLQKIWEEAEKLVKSVQSNSSAMEKFSGTLTRIGGVLGGFSALQSVGTSILNLGDKLEQANISFEVMLGSADKAKKMLADLSKFAQNTPFELQGIRDSAKQFMAMGIPAEKMIQTLKVLGDISAGTGAPLQQIAYAYGQVATAGVATTQDMNQLVNAGIPIWKELGKVVGATASEVKKMVEGRQITFEQVETALTNMTEKGWQFANLMEAQSKTLTGQWNAFKDSLGAIGETIGLKVLPFFKWLIDWLNKLIEFFGTFTGKTVLLITGLTTGWLAIVKFIWFLGWLATAFGVATSGVKIFGVALSTAIWPITLTIGAIVWLIGAVEFFMWKSAEAKKKQEELQYASMTTAEKIEHQKQKLAELNKEYEKWKISADEYKQKLSEINGELDTQKQNLEKAAKFQEEYNKRQEEIAKLKSNHDQDGMKSKLEELKKEQEFYNQELEQEKTRFEQKFQLQNQALLKDKAYWEQRKNNSIEGAWHYQQAVQVLANIEKQLEESKQNLINTEWQHRTSIEQNIAKLAEQRAEVENMLKIEWAKDISLQNLENRIRILNEEQVKLTEQYRTGAISVEEYNQKMAENKAKLKEAEFATGEYKKWLDIVQNEQLWYADKLEMINGLKVSTNQYNALIQKLIQVQNETIKALKLKALLLEQAVPVLDMGWKAVGKIENVVSNSSVWKLTWSLLNKIPWGDKFKNFAKNAYQDAKDATKRVVADAVSPELAKTYALIDEAEKVKKDLEGKIKDTTSAWSSWSGWKSSKKWWGGGGKSGKSKETEEAKKAQKAEEDLQKSRTNAYKDAQKLSEKYQNIVVDTTKKMAEQKKKMEEIRQSALDTIADIDEQLADKKDTYQEKIAKRYSEIFKELKEFFRQDNLRSVFAHYKDDDFKKMFEEWELNETDTSDFAKNIREFQYIQKNLDAEELTLAVKKEQRSEAQKLTEEYKEQKALLENSLAMNEAVRAGRYITNAEGGLSFFDEKGNAIEGMGNKQRKEFRDMAKKLQDVADAELKIQTEKEEKIFQIYKEFDDERKRLNEGYFWKDKEMRLEQHRMMEEFFMQEIAKMKELSSLASSFSTSQKSASVSDNKVVSESWQKSESIFKNEEKILDERAAKNAEILQKFHDIVAKIESGITNTTESEINRRMTLYAQEEARLNALIAKRIKAGYVIPSVPREFQNVNNTTNNSATINVNATSQGSIDANHLANTIMRKVQNYQKWIK